MGCDIGVCVIDSSIYQKRVKMKGENINDKKRKKENRKTKSDSWTVKKR
jgi:hypothetical protein